MHKDIAFNTADAAVSTDLFKSASIQMICTFSG